MNTPLLKIILDEIAIHGAMPFYRYMTLCLTHHEYGYYRQSDCLGRDGDFITAPEISQMFGELVGLWLYHQAQAQRLVRPAIVELGPGRGTLMADLLRAVSAASTQTNPTPDIHLDIHPDIHLVEINPVFRQTQKTHLADSVAGKIIWHDSIATLPPGPLLVIANEFFDALPIHRLVARNGSWVEQKITATDGNLAVIEAGTPADDVIANSNLAPQPDGTIAEICPDGIQIARHLSAHIAQHGGAMLIIDYGKDNPLGDTLQGVCNHKPCDILSAPGCVDLCAWVDFSSLRSAAQASGVMATAMVEQGAFLKALGIYERAEALGKAADTKERRQIVAAVERLTSAAHMGSAFKAMALAPKGALPVAGF